jgi:hypothetical protein
MGLSKVHYTTLRRAVYVEFAKGSGKIRHPGSAILLQGYL